MEIKTEIRNVFGHAKRVCVLLVIFYIFYLLRNLLVFNDISRDINRFDILNTLQSSVFYNTKRIHSDD